MGPVDVNYCKGKKCTEGQGDCDSHDECLGNLVCGKDNCKDFNPEAKFDTDCCVKAGMGLIMAI